MVAYHWYIASYIVCVRTTRLGKIRQPSVISPYEMRTTPVRTNSRDAHKKLVERLACWWRSGLRSQQGHLVVVELRVENSFD